MIFALLGDLGLDREGSLPFLSRCDWWGECVRAPRSISRRYRCIKRETNYLFHTCV